MPEEPRLRDHMPGRYLMRCKGARCQWRDSKLSGTGCSGGCGWGRGRTTKWRRKVEKAALQRWLRKNP